MTTIERAGILRRSDGNWQWYASNMNDAFIRDQIWIRVEDRNTEFSQITVAVDAKPFRSLMVKGFARRGLDAAFVHVVEAVIKDWDTLALKYTGAPIDFPELPPQVTQPEKLLREMHSANTADSRRAIEEDMRRTLSYTEAERRAKEVPELMLAELQAQTQLLREILHELKERTSVSER